MVREKREATPGLTDRKRSISAVYPATITTTASRWSSISFTSVSMASRPKSRPESSGDRAYASSMNSTPPRARSNASWVRIAVEPMCSPTRSTRDTSTRCPLLQHAERGQDLAVQPGDRGLAGAGGAGEDQMAAGGGRLEARPAARRRPTSIMSVRARTSRLTLSRPTSASSSPRTSSAADRGGHRGRRSALGDALVRARRPAARGDWWPTIVCTAVAGTGRGRSAAALVAGAVLDDRPPPEACRSRRRRTRSRRARSAPYGSGVSVGAAAVDDMEAVAARCP